jgi:hypothetical protein
MTSGLSTQNPPSHRRAAAPGFLLKLLPLALSSPFAPFASPNPPLVASVDFTSQIQPILQNHCRPCHGPEKQKSDYRLDSRPDALRGGDSGNPAILPGNAQNSPFFHAISGQNPDLAMPPEKSAQKRLSRDQIDLLKTWINEGAPWDPALPAVAKKDPLDWWSLRPLRQPALPESAITPHPVDAFLQDKLREHSLQPAPPADRATLLRRVHYDLTGLPPSHEEIQAFLADPAPDAYERVVDRLLASPRYGERWARHWLDVVHYGDTHGYDKDQPRPNAWPYRDYVIRAFNEDRPYARFVQEQIAGDVLFPGTRDGIEALGFLAAGPWDLIGHREVSEEKTDGKIARHLDRDDMVSTTIGTFCSATIHCAQCHNHKFDPFTQEDYYSLQAVFSALDRTDKKYFADPAMTARYTALENRLADLSARQQALQKKLADAAGEPLRDLDRKIADEEKKKGGNARAEFGYHSALAPSEDVVKWVQVDLGESLPLDHVLLHPCFDTFNNIGAGFGFPKRFRIEASEDSSFQNSVILLADRTRQDVPNPGTKTQRFSAQGAKARFVRITAVKLAPRKNDFIFALAELKVIDSTGLNVAAQRPVQSLDSIEAPPRWRQKNLVDSIAPEDPATEVTALKAQRQYLLATAGTPAERDQLTALEKQLREANDEKAAYPKPDVVYAATIHHGTGNFRGTGPNGGKPRPIFLLSRGQVTQPKTEMHPGALSALPFAPARFSTPNESEGERRAALARWITHADNPLTWRSIVNRVWHYHFGRGLCETPNDFGKNGGAPSHPELLDWLAADFRNHGGSLKALHRLLLTSHAYRQTSAPNADAQRIDANNTLLWRQNRRKLEAEAIRDSVLWVTGKLDLTMGGPGWQDFVIEHPQHSPHYQYHLANPEDPTTWRRSVYRFIVRSQTQPWMTSLDCADPSIRVDKRNESLSAPQALALLNNGFMVTQARHFAERVERECSGSLEERVAFAHELALGTRPHPERIQKLAALAREHGLANACRLILNLNAFAFVD